MPKEIFNFKSLLHPARLTISKLLVENVSLTSVEIRGALGVSWNELNNHLGWMKKNEMITIDLKFIDGNQRNVVSANSILEKMYVELRDVLSDFFHTASNLDSYIKYAEDATDIRKSHDDMYPDEGN